MFSRLRSFARTTHHAVSTRWSGALMLVGAAAAAGFVVIHESPQERFLSRTHRALAAERFTTGRLADQSWGACRLVAADSFVPRYRCAASPAPGSPLFALLATLVEQSRAFVAHPSPSSLHATALLDLRHHGDNTHALDRAVNRLEIARRTGARSPGLLNDLAVAYLQTAERDQALSPMLRALDVVEAALANDPTLVPALFNRALILDRLNFVALADGAWQRYLAAERDARWKHEAQAYRTALLQRLDTLAPQDFPQLARERAFTLVGRLGNAVESGDAEETAALSAQWSALADSVRAIPSDRTVSLAYDWFHTLPSAARRRAGAALAQLSEGVSLHDRSLYEPAVGPLRDASSGLEALRSPLAVWATLYYAAVETNRRHFEIADSLLETVFVRAGVQQPAALGKALWLRGAGRMRTGRIEAGNAAYAAARRYFEEAHDAKNLGAVSFLLTEGLAREGDEAGALVEGFRGLRDLARFRQSYYLHGHLIAVAAVARAAKLRFVALDVTDEAFAVNQTLGQGDASVRARCIRATDLAAVGDTAAAFDQLNAASTIAEGLEEDRREQARAEITFTRGKLLSRREAVKASSLLEDALNAYRRLGTPARLASVLYELALVSQHRGDSAGARAHLREAAGIIDRQRASISVVEGRAAFDETIESVFDAMIGAQLDAGRPDSALSYLERQRAAVWSQSPSDSGSSSSDRPVTSVAQVAAQLRPDMAALIYAVLPDRVAIWFARRDTTFSLSLPVGRDSLGALIARVEGDGAPAAEATRRTLFDVLIAPVAARLSGVTHLAVIPDRELMKLSFAALLDPANRFLIERYSVRTEPSAAFLIKAMAVSSKARATARASALVVGNPALGASESALTTLAGAGTEAEQVAALYPSHRLMFGRDADRQSILSTLARSSLFHFAGHAVFNASRPELSYLALAADSASSAGRLTAREIASLRLSNIRLVVLSACRSVSSRPSRTGVAAGLAFSFLRAGVSATVSTIWDVSDNATVGLLVEFHRQLRNGVEAPEALRLAQLTAVHSPDPLLRSPAVWAAFIYTGS